MDGHQISRSADSRNPVVGRQKSGPGYVADGTHPGPTPVPAVASINRGQLPPTSPWPAPTGRRMAGDLKVRLQSSTCL